MKTTSSPVHSRCLPASISGAAASAESSSPQPTATKPPTVAPLSESPLAAPPNCNPAKRDHSGRGDFDNISPPAKRSCRVFPLGVSQNADDPTALQTQPKSSDDSSTTMAKHNPPQGSAEDAADRGVDSDLYSRQIGAFGFETMSRLVKMKILISGLRGVGVETAKNLILAGPGRVTLHDDCPTELRDLASNFYAKETDVQKRRSRGQASLAQLSGLNNYVNVDLHEGPLDDILKNYDLVIFSETRKSELVRYNRICRSCSPQVGFIVVNTFGVCTSIFVDFGEEFSILDQDGEEPKSVIVAAITKENPGTVHTHTEKPLPFQHGDHVSFRELRGMEELNESAPRPIKVIGKHTFTIEDTSGYSAYEREGTVFQVKVPKTVRFGSFEERCVSPLADGASSLPMPDLGKFGRPEQLHFAIQALMTYQEEMNNGKLPACRDTAAVAKCCGIARDLNEKSRAAGSSVSVDEIDEEVVANVVNFSAVSISPVTSFAGGIAAQEAVKFTRKFTPIHQWLYVDAFEMIPPNNPTDCIPKTPTRYDDQIWLWGHEFQRRISQLKIFLVGAGALGCELLKQFALMGYCSGDTGVLTVTDMDNIEISNLNRQFLFGRQHIGKPKSLIAGEAAKAMNSEFKVNTMTARVGPETEDLFDDRFWEGLDIVVNALDNVPSRLYIDGRCVWYNKSLMESGTLGTKANVQVVLPRMTESYGDSQDPPEESIPLCTLKHFPHEIEHTIEWSRDAFQGFFTDGPQQAVLFLKDTRGFLARLENEEAVPLQRERLQKIRDILTLRAAVTKASSSADPTAPQRHCIESALVVFHDFFYSQISQLLHNFPADHMTTEGRPFWSGPKRHPTAVKFDPQDPLHVAFVQSTANVLGATLGVEMRTEQLTIADVAQRLHLPDYVPRQVRIKVDDNDTSTVEGAGDDDTALAELRIELSNLAENTPSTLSINSVDFEKDDDTNFHIQFIWACANLRARNYTITECDKHKAKMIAGKIIPAIATTTAMVTGLVGIEIVKAIDFQKRKIEDFKNSFVNLSLPLWLFSEPMPPSKTVDKDYDTIARGPVRVWPREGFTTWDKTEIKIPNGTVEQMLQHVEKLVNVDVAIVSVGNCSLYNSFLPGHKDRLKQPVKDLYEKISKTTLPPGRNYVSCELSCSSKDDDVDIIIPVIKFCFA